MVSVSIYKTAKVIRLSSRNVRHTSPNTNDNQRLPHWQPSVLQLSTLNKRGSCQLFKQTAANVPAAYSIAVSPQQD